MPKYPRGKGKSIDLPVYGNPAHNMGIYQAIGVLVVNWGSDESVFLAMLQALLGGDKQTAIIMWLSFYNTANRLELVRRLTKQHVSTKRCGWTLEALWSSFADALKPETFSATPHMVAMIKRS
jgi:hypothetical protein